MSIIILDPEIESLWNDEVVTLGTGAGYDYTDLNTCHDSVDSGTLVLVYPGLYDATSRFTKNLLFKSMGSSIGDVVFGNTQDPGGNDLGAQGSAHLVFEGIELRDNHFYAWRSNFFVYSEDVEILFNKCYFSVVPHNSHAFDISYIGPAPITFRNCRLDCGYNTMRGYISEIRHEKSYTPSYSCYQCTGSYEYNDRVTTPTSGYGYEYGDYLITVGSPTTWFYIGETPIINVYIGSTEIDTIFIGETEVPKPA
jgi:hypothetical protein